MTFAWLAHLRRVAIVAAVVAAGTAHADAPSFPNVTSTTFASTDGDLPVPDDGSLVSLLRVEALSGQIVDVDVTLDLPHTRSDNLEIWLIAPSSRTITLTTDNGGENDNVFAPVTFDDQAPGTASAANVRNVEYMDLAPIGRVQPEGALAAFVGEDPNGLWALVVVDDRGDDERGTLRGWSLTVSTVPAFPAPAPVTFSGGGNDIPDDEVGSLDSSVVVSGQGTDLWDVNVQVDIRHERASDLDLFLTAPSGRRIDLVTDVGDFVPDLYAGTTFDDGAGVPVSDHVLPEDGTAFTAVVPEGALGAFLGEDPNGTWTLTIVDDQGGGNGTLAGWALVVSAPCRSGPGCADPPPPPPPPPGTEVLCSECVGTDGLVRTDVPGCEAADLQLSLVRLVPPRGLATRGNLKVGAWLLSSWPTTGSVGILVADANGVLVCGTLGEITNRGTTLTVRGTAARGAVVVKIKPGGRVLIRGLGIDLTSFDDPALTIGLRFGAERFLVQGGLRSRGTRWVYP